MLHLWWYKRGKDKENTWLPYQVLFFFFFLQIIHKTVSSTSTMKTLLLHLFLTKTCFKSKTNSLIIHHLRDRAIQRLHICEWNAQLPKSAIHRQSLQFPWWVLCTCTTFSSVPPPHWDKSEASGTWSPARTCEKTHYDPGKHDRFRSVLPPHNLPQTLPRGFRPECRARNSTSQSSEWLKPPWSTKQARHSRDLTLLHQNFVGPPSTLHSQFDALPDDWSASQQDPAVRTQRFASTRHPYA